MIVEFQFDVSPFRAALAAAPDVEVEMEHLVASDTVPLRTFFWAHGPELDAFEAALESDPTIREPRRIASKDGSRLFRVEHPSDLPAVAAYHAAVELDAVVLDVTASDEGVEVRMRFPDRDALAEWRDRIRELDLSIHVTAIHEEDEAPPERHYGLTDQQHETLVVAAREGYFSIPRETSLAGLADELDVSSQAASERLRRGMENLVFSTLDE